MKKVFTLLTLALLSIGSAWADTETSPVGGTKDNDVVGTSFTIGGTFNAGSATQLANMETKGIKIRTNRDDNTLKIQVNDGYTINSVDIYIASNDNPSKLSVTGITVDGTAYTPGGVTYPLEVAAKDASNDATVIAVATPATDNITLSFGGKGTQGIMELHVDYTSNATLPHINAEDTSITATESGVEVTKDIDVTGANLAGSTLTATLSPAVPGLSVSLASNKITAGAISTKATLHYSATENASGSTTLTLSDGTTAKAVTINYSANVTTWVLQPVSEAKTWDFSKLTMNTEHAYYDSDSKAILLTAETSPTVNDEFVYENYAGSFYTIGAGFDGTALAFKGQYPIRQNKYAQAGELHFKVAVPGTITVKFSDTGSSKSATAVKRYLVVNDVTTEYWASRENNGDEPYAEQLNVTTDPIAVEAGDVNIKGTSALVYYFVTFTPSAVSVTVPSSGVGTFACAQALDFTSADVEAYVVSAVSASAATLEKVTAVPANTGIILKGTAGAHSIPVAVSADAPATNLLKAAVTATAVGANEAYVLKDGLFHLVNTASTVPAGKAYLLASDVKSPELSLDFDGTGEISTGIENVEAQKGFLDGEFYNLNGQRVAQPTKGLYIVNGRKVIFK